MRYDLASSSWRTSEATSLWDLEMSSPTFPEWGMTRGGELYELPTPERPTVAPASSSLPTPNARDWKEQTLGWQHTRNGVVQEDLLPRALTALMYSTGALLPTPVADHSRGLAQPGTDFQSLPNVAMSLLPTPTVMDMGANYTPEQWASWKAEQKANHANGNGHGASLTQEAISLPTPTAQAAKHGETPDVNANGFGSNLWDLPTLIGASTPPRLPAGSASSTAPHPAPPSPAPTDDPDCLPLSWSG
jgi:hypothetical protein